VLGLGLEVEVERAVATVLMIVGVELAEKRELVGKVASA
jgi:hypothetical protein